MPPLAVVGFGIATANATVVAGSLLLFLTNAVTIALTAALIARLYGFGSHLSHHHTGLQLALFVVALGLLSFPLGAALRQIAFESVAQRQVRDTIQQRFPDGSRLSTLEIDHNSDPMRIRAVVLTPRLDPDADRVLNRSVRERLNRAVNLHVDQLQVSGSGGVEAAQIARANSSAGLVAGASRDRARADLALIAGVDASAVQASEATRALLATAAPLPGLAVAGYRALELRARRALPDWDIRLAPPAEVDPPAMRVVEGVVDAIALDDAAWASARLDRVLTVSGGTRAQRDAVAEGIVARGGQASPTDAGGALRLEWEPAPEASPAPAPSPQA